MGGMKVPMKTIFDASKVVNKLDIRYWPIPYVPAKYFDTVDLSKDPHRLGPLAHLSVFVPAEPQLRAIVKTDSMPGATISCI